MENLCVNSNEHSIQYPGNQRITLDIDEQKTTERMKYGRLLESFRQNSFLCQYFQTAACFDAICCNVAKVKQNCVLYENIDGKGKILGATIQLCELASSKFLASRHGIRTAGEINPLTCSSK